MKRHVQNEMSLVLKMFGLLINNHSSVTYYTSRSTRRCPGSNVSLCMANSF
jgi:hypothetical protein